MSHRFRAALLAGALLFPGRGDLCGQETNVWGVGSTNLDRVGAFWRAVEDGNGPVTVLAFGDSMTASYQSVQTELFKRLETRLGTSGYSLRTYRNTTLWQYKAGAAASSGSLNWWTGHGTLPPGSSIYWTNLNDPLGSLICDRVGVYWVAHPAGGEFRLSVSTNGGDWSSPLLSLDGFSASRVGRYTNLPLTRLKYRLRVDGVSGINLILGPEYLDTSSTGLHIAFMDQAGADLNKIFACSTNVLLPILSALNPHLIIYHMKELGDLGETGFSNRLIDLEALWQAGVANGDVAYLGTPYDYRDTNQVYTPSENRLLREAAVRHGRAYLDCMSPCVSYESMVTNGFIPGGIHPNNACNAFLADMLWPQLGFFALRKERRLAITHGEGAVQVTWPTSPEVHYELQRSTNLLDWTAAQSAPGDGRWQVYTNPAPGATHTWYRLRLTPD